MNAADEQSEVDEETESQGMCGNSSFLETPPLISELFSGSIVGLQNFLFVLSSCVDFENLGCRIRTGPFFC